MLCALLMILFVAGIILAIVGTSKYVFLFSLPLYESGWIINLRVVSIPLWVKTSRKLWQWSRVERFETLNYSQRFWTVSNDFERFLAGLSDMRWLLPTTTSNYERVLKSIVNGHWNCQTRPELVLFIVLLWSGFTQSARQFLVKLRR